MNRRTSVVQEARQSQRQGPRSSADFVGSFEYQHGKAGLGNRRCRAQAVWTRADHDRVPSCHSAYSTLSGEGALAGVVWQETPTILLLWGWNRIAGKTRSEERRVGKACRS